MAIDINKRFSLFDQAALAHGWAQDMGTKTQAAIALANYQQARINMELAINEQLVEIGQFREALQGLLDALPSATTHPAIKAARAALSGADHHDQ